MARSSFFVASIPFFFAACTSFGGSGGGDDPEVTLPDATPPLPGRDASIAPPTDGSVDPPTDGATDATVQPFLCSSLNRAFIYRCADYEISGGSPSAVYDDTGSFSLSPIMLNADARVERGRLVMRNTSTEQAKWQIILAFSSPAKPFATIDVAKVDSPEYVTILELSGENDAGTPMTGKLQASSTTISLEGTIGAGTRNKGGPFQIRIDEKGLYIDGTHLTGLDANLRGLTTMHLGLSRASRAGTSQVEIESLHLPK